MKSGTQRRQELSPSRRRRGPGSQLDVTNSSLWRSCAKLKEGLEHLLID
jgi:hypothetical protein